MALQSSRALQGVYRVTDKDGVVYGVELVPHGRRRMSGYLQKMLIFLLNWNKRGSRMFEDQIQN